MSQVITRYHSEGKKKVTTSDMSPDFQRLENLRISQNWTWAQVGEAIGVKTAMIMMVKSGQRHLSSKSLYRLEQIERELGIEPPEIRKDVARKKTAEEILQNYSPEDLAKLTNTIREEIEKTLNQFIVDAGYLAETVELFAKNPANQKIASDLSTLVFEVKTKAEFLKRIRNIDHD